MCGQETEGCALQNITLFVTFCDDRLPCFFHNVNWSGCLEVCHLLETFVYCFYCMLSDLHEESVWFEGDSGFRIKKTFVLMFLAYATLGRACAEFFKASSCSDNVLDIK